MPEFFNPLDIEKWRQLIRDFDAKRVAFFENLAALKSTRGATPELEQERQKLISQAGPIEKNIGRLMNSLGGIRDFVKGTGRFFGFGEPQNLGIPPLIIAGGIAGAVIIVRSITSWLTKTSAYAKRNELAKTLVDAGATPQEIIEATGQKLPGQSSAKILGFDVRWLLALGAIVVIAPYALKMLNERR